MSYSRSASTSLPTLDIFLGYGAVQAIMTGGTVLKVTIDPNLGGATIVQGGNPTLTLSAGYIGSTLMGALFILAGWDTLVAKVMSFVLGIGMVTPLVLVRDKL